MKGSVLLWHDARGNEAKTDFIRKRRIYDSKVYKTFIYWPRSFLIKEWKRHCMNIHASLTDRNRPTAQSATVDCDYWFPQGLCLCLTASPRTAFFLIFLFKHFFLQAGSHCEPPWLFQLYPANSSCFFSCFSSLLGLKLLLLYPRSRDLNVIYIPFN